jgi:isopentenyldiphosphate isomerase
MIELLDLVDEQDQVVRQCQRGEEKLFPGLWFRGVAIFLRRPTGEFWIPIRAAHKQLFPKCIDSSVAGHVSAGESYIETALRETVEETGLVLSKEQLQEAFILHPIQAQISCFTGVYLADIGELEPTLHPQDHHSASWMTAEELFQRIERGHPVRSDLPAVLHRLFRF